MRIAFLELRCSFGGGRSSHYGEHHATEIMKRFAVCKLGTSLAPNNDPVGSSDRNQQLPLTFKYDLSS
ncbi:hypothetical protein Mapa_003808 [Marchantia paleacea]|nr:hypothetical protein Mapa_003808 [Marchantia paleacea]